ncbi:AlpA family phage regulatory protein [Citrobacter portucalensis]|nr:AlpA family phage regulatory protein [Citrobacter portucalensis]MBW9459728.1 AlpA family phage regulatory protein [Citrobacter portucalensis]
MFAGKKSAQIREILISESAWEEMTCLFAPSLSDKWFYKLIQDGLFPKPIKLGRASRWLKSDLEEWLYYRIYESRN